MFLQLKRRKSHSNESIEYRGKHIFDEIIGPTGLLADKTRILVTHGIGFLPKTDQIIVLIDGSISEVGSYKELLHQKKAFAEFLTVYLAEAAEENPETAVIKAELIQEIGSKPALERGVSIVSQVSLRKVKAVLEHRDSKMPPDDLLDKKGAAAKVRRFYLMVTLGRAEPSRAMRNLDYVKNALAR